MAILSSKPPSKPVQALDMLVGGAHEVGRSCLHVERLSPKANY